MRLKVLVLAFALLPAVVPAQQPTGRTAQPQISIAPGTRVRVRASTLVAPLIANFMEVRADTLLFFEEGAGRGIWSVTFDKLQGVERSIGHHSMHRPYIIKGAALGAGAGLVGGLVFASLFSPSDPNRDYSGPLTAGVGALFGAGLGAFIGSRRSAEQWATVTLPARMSLRGDMRGARLSFSF